LELAVSVYHGTRIGLQHLGGLPSKQHVYELCRLINQLSKIASNSP